MADRDEAATSRYGRRSPLARPRSRGGGHSAGRSQRRPSAWDYLTSFLGRSATSNSRGPTRHMRRRWAGVRWRSGTRKRGRWGRLGSTRSVSVTSDIAGSTTEKNGEAQRGAFADAYAARSGAFAQQLANALRNPAPPRFPPPAVQPPEKRLRDAAVEEDTVVAKSSDLRALSASSPPGPTGAPRPLPSTTQPPLHQPQPAGTQSPLPPTPTPSQQQPLPALQEPPLASHQQQPILEPPQAAPPQRPPLLPLQSTPAPPQLPQMQPLLHPRALLVAPPASVAAKVSKGTWAYEAGGALPPTAMLDRDAILTAPADSKTSDAGPGSQASWFAHTVVDDSAGANYDNGDERWAETNFPLDRYRYGDARRDSNLSTRRHEKLRSSISLHRRRGRSRNQRKYYEYEDEDSDSESDSELSSDDSDDNESPSLRSRNRCRRKHRRRHAKRCRCYRRSICECDEILQRLSRPPADFARKWVSQLGETGDQQTLNGGFPDFYEEVTEDYLAPGHPDYSAAAFGGPVVRRTRTVLPYGDRDIFLPHAQSSKIGRLASTRQWKSGQEQPWSAFGNWMPERPPDIHMLAGGGQQALSGSAYVYEDRTFDERYAVPPYGTVPAEFFCGMCGYLGCPGDCWTWANQPRSELEERLRLDERQRLDFEERARMQERIDRLEERMWMYNCWASRWGRRPIRDDVDLFEGHGTVDEQFDGKSYTSASEYYGRTDPNEAASFAAYGADPYVWLKRDEMQRLRRQSLLSYSDQVKSEDKSKRYLREKSASRDRRGSWEQPRCSLTDDAHRGSSNSIASGSNRKSKKGKRRKKGQRATDETSDDAEEPLTDAKAFRWDSATLLPVAPFVWSTSKPPTSTRRRKSVSYGHGATEDSTQDKIAEEELSTVHSLDQAGMSRRRSAAAVAKPLNRRASLIADEEKQCENTKGTSDLSLRHYETAVGTSGSEAKEADAKPGKPVGLDKSASTVKTVAQQTDAPPEKMQEAAPNMPAVPLQKPEEAAHDAGSQEMYAAAYGGDAEKDMQDVTLSSTNLFPETGVVCIISLLALVWIVIVLVTSAVIHSDYLTETTPATTPPWQTPSGARPGEHNDSLEPYYCHTVRCLREGDYLRSLISGFERPCDNFYRHVCDRWSHVVGRTFPPEAVSTDTQLQSVIQHTLVSLIENVGPGANVKPASDLLNACGDRSQANSRSIDQVKGLFQKWSIRKWPVGSYDDGRLEDVWSLAGDLVRDLDLAVIAGLTVAFNPANIKTGIVAFFQADPLPVLYLDDDRDLLTAAFREAVTAFGVTDAAHVDVLLQEALSSFSILDSVLDVDASTEAAKVSTLWRLDSGYSSLVSAALGSHTVLDVSSPVLLLNAPFLEVYLPTTLRNVSTPPRIFLNHLGFRALVRIAAFLPDNLTALRQLSLLESTGFRAPPDHVTLCTRAVERAMPMCVLKALAVPLSRTSKGVWQRHSILDLQTIFLRGLRRVRWIDELSLYTLSFRLQRWRFDSLYPTDLAWDSSPCGLISPSHMAPVERLVDAFSQRLRAVPRQLQASPGWRVIPPLSVWPLLDLPALAVRVPLGLLNSSLPSNDTLSTFQLAARVAARLYTAIVPLLYTGTVYDREAALDISSDSQRRLDDLRECLLADWNSVRRRLQLTPPSRMLNAQRWFRDWLLEQAAGVHLALYAFRELLHVGRIWRIDFRLANLKHVSSTKLFFLYYALDHCERSSELYQRRRMRLHVPPASLRVVLPLRHLRPFADEFQCAHRDLMKADAPCRIFDL